MVEMAQSRNLPELLRAIVTGICDCSFIGLARIYGKFVASNLPDLSVLADNKQTPVESVRVEIMDRLKVSSLFPALARGPNILLT